MLQKIRGENKILEMKRVRKIKAREFPRSLSKEQEVVDIMMTLFDDEQILEAYAEDIKNNEARKTAKRYAITMLGKGGFQ